MARQGMEIRGDTIGEKIQSIGLVLKRMNSKIERLDSLLSRLMLKVEKLQREKIPEAEVEDKPIMIENSDA